MTTIAPFKALRPRPELAKQVASKPYDVLSSREAKEEAAGNSYSFLHITKSEIDLPENTDVHDTEVYNKAKENLSAFMQRDILFRENKACYYIYQLTMNGNSQTGLVCTSSVDDYENDIIKKHEFTRPEKEQDRINHIRISGAQTGNVFLAYRNVEEMDVLIEDWKATHDPVYNFVAEDDVTHTIWIINNDDKIAAISHLFSEKVPCTYIADGHHRAASAAKVRAHKNEQGNTQRQDSNADNNANFFLTTLFPSNQLRIMDYNRVVKDLNGLSEDEFIKAIGDKFEITAADAQVSPSGLHEFGMFLAGKWYKLTSKPGTFTGDPIGVLDVTILSDNLLDPILGIKDQRTDTRIDFVGGIRGLAELEKRVDGGEAALAISIYPVSIDQLLAVADSGEVMPPKSTWFEPKLRDGLLTHLID
ncbi:MAG: DUF1015 domain-containing protein [Chitinophagaceae bacterium]|nr:MAG: DUF1015 domain-containing protein [Chitinophagaceae bacterium]